MTLLVVLNWYISANLLLWVAVLLLGALRAFGQRFRHPVTYRHQLRIGNALVLAMLLLPLGSQLSGKQRIFPPTGQVWSAPTMHASAVDVLDDPRIAVTFVSAGSASLITVGNVVTALVLIGFIFWHLRMALDAWTTIRLINGSHAIRKIQRLRILASERTSVPFSFWLPAQYFIVVPASLILLPDSLRIAIQHEAQHHRQGDTKWIYLYQLVKALFFWNPAAHRIEKDLRELQEFACDEALRKRHDTSIRDYCNCLLQVAEGMLREPRAILRANMSGASSTALLKRRIDALMKAQKHPQRRVTATCIGSGFLILMVGVAAAFTGPISDRRVSIEEAQRMAVAAQRGSTFPIVINDRVLRQLNLLLGTPDGRASLKASVERLQAHRMLVTEQLARHALPIELLAVPLVESGYRNLPPSGNPRQGAGLWMFIEPTAKRFGLTVNANRDERLNAAMETRAAMRYFSDLHAEFNDWGLALLGYNAGSAQVNRAIRDTGSRDVWELIGNGHENDSDYVARVMATILILKNPSALVFS